MHVHQHNYSNHIVFPPQFPDFYQPPTIRSTLAPTNNNKTPTRCQETPGLLAALLLFTGVSLMKCCLVMRPWDNEEVRQRSFLWWCAPSTKHYNTADADEQQKTIQAPVKVGWGLFCGSKHGEVLQVKSWKTNNYKTNSTRSPKKCVCLTLQW